MINQERQSKGGISAIHLACMLGNLDILRILHFKFNADLGSRTEHGLTPLHCAALVNTGIVAIYFLQDVMYKFSVDVIDNEGASPLHYSIMSIEENNIQALLSLGADINLQDNHGDSMLHVALARYINDQENYGVYKEVIKEMLQFGARRDIINNEGYTPEQLNYSYKNKILLQTPEDYT